VFATKTASSWRPDQNATKLLIELDTRPYQAPMPLTISERRFRAFCRQHRLRFKRLPVSPRSGEQTPDFLLRRFGQMLAVEIKQVDPTPAELVEIAKFEAGGISSSGGEPGGRARNAIAKGARQLRALTRGRIPGLLVLYDNMPMPTIHLDPYAIKVAMYGLEEIVMDRPTIESVRSQVVDTRFGGKRRVTPTDNTSLSAVALLTAHSSDEFTLDIFHNCFAVRPLYPWLFRRRNIRHWRLSAKAPGQSQEWELA
jgi:hypothetical protein